MAVPWFPRSVLLNMFETGSVVSHHVRAGNLEIEGAGGRGTRLKLTGKGFSHFSMRRGPEGNSFKQTIAPEFLESARNALLTGDFAGSPFAAFKPIATTIPVVKAVRIVRATKPAATKPAKASAKPAKAKAAPKRAAKVHAKARKAKAKPAAAKTS